MARIRHIKPDFFLDEEVAALEPIARLLFVGLWTLADREGRLEDRPARIKVQILPFDNCDADALLGALSNSGFIVRYSVDERRYLQIRSFAKHQHPHPKEQTSTIPAPFDDAVKRNVQAAGSNGKERTSKPLSLTGSSGSSDNRDSAKAKPREPSLLDRLILVFAAKWERTHGAPYVVTGGDRGQFGRLLRTLTTEQSARLPEVFDRYLADTDKFLLERSSKHSLKWLATNGYNAYSAPKNGVPEQRNLIQVPANWGKAPQLP